MPRVAAAAVVLFVGSVGVASASSLGGVDTATLGAVQCTVTRAAQSQPGATELLVHCQGRDIPATNVTVFDEPTGDEGIDGATSSVPTDAGNTGMDSPAPERPERDSTVANSAEEGVVGTPAPHAEDTADPSEEAR